MSRKVHVISIAGFDPSGGAGILADIKTFEAHAVDGFGVCTAVTVQNDTEFKYVKWIRIDEILDQIKILTEKFEINWVKIGLIENWDVLSEVIGCLKAGNEEIGIIWDPIIKSSSGAVFHEEISEKKLFDICRNLALAMPNIEEMQRLVPGMEIEEAGRYLSEQCPVLVKGGHGSEEKVTDILFMNGEDERFVSDRIDTDKHGTGCVLSSSVLSHLAKGENLVNACRNAKLYVNEFMESNPSLLGRHKY